MKIFFPFLMILLPFSHHRVEAQPTRKPNVLFIAVDDLRPELGSLGNSIVRTPNLDRLSGKAVTFRNHFVLVPTCGASRFSLLTGLRPRTPGHLSNEACRNFISGEPETGRPETFIHHLRRAGYRTVGVGKISHYADGLLYGYRDNPAGAVRELPHSWDELMFEPGKWETGWNAFFGYADGSNRQDREGEVRPYERGEVGDEGYPDGITAGLAVEKLRALASEEKPFLLAVGFFKPHLPFTAPQKYWDLYERNSLPLTQAPGIPKNVHAASLHQSGEFNSYKSGSESPSLSQPLSQAYAATLTHAYYAAVSYVDAQIGRVLDELTVLGLAENTVIVVWGDHGWHLGDHNVWGKHTLSEYALRSPLIIRLPRHQRGYIADDVVSTEDIYPTLMSACQVPMPYSTDGRDLSRLLQGSKKTGKRAAYGYYNKGFTARTHRYRITRYFRDPSEAPLVELYDYRKDPHETRNIAGQRPGKTRRLLRVLEAGDTGLFR